MERQGQPWPEKTMMPLIGLILLLLTAPALASDNSLVARVIDGDTIVVGGQKIRYIGINAPEAHRNEASGNVYEYL